MSFIRSAIDKVRDRYAPITHTSTFRETGQITPEEFLEAGDFLVYKFPSWSWSPATSASQKVSYLPDDKQFLVTRGVPCHRRLNDNFAGDAGLADEIEKGQLQGSGGAGGAEDDDEGWLRTGGPGGAAAAAARPVHELDGSGNIGAQVEEEEIPDMEDEDDEAIIREAPTEDPLKAPLRTYSLYITYTPYYRTPRVYLSGYGAGGEPLVPTAMMEDIVGDYKDKTVTLEDFPFFDAATSVKMASVHPCKHASVMKVLLDRADAALKLRREKLAKGGEAKAPVGMEGLVENTADLSLGEKGHRAGVAAAGGNGGDEWEVLQAEGGDQDESAIRVDQYLVVFLKFIASVTPGIEHDFTMGI